ncbi:MAG: hypothetical protein M1829_002703, partial [Trizodia sp. TS-e1964]
VEEVYRRILEEMTLDGAIVDKVVKMLKVLKLHLKLQDYQIWLKIRVDFVNLLWAYARVNFPL